MRRYLSVIFMSLIASVSYSKTSKPLFEIEVSNYSLPPAHQYAKTCTIYPDKIERKVKIGILPSTTTETSVVRIENLRDLTALIPVIINAPSRTSEPGNLGGERTLMSVYDQLSNDSAVLQNSVNGTITEEADATITAPLVNLVKSICRH